MAKKYLLLSLFIISCFWLPAQGLFESITSERNDNGDEGSFSLNGYVRGSAYGGSKAYDFSTLFGEFALQGRLSRGKTFFYGDVRVREGLFFDERQTIVELKEAYAAYRGENSSFYIGNQIVSWGRTDGFNPTDNITPHDYFFLTPDHDDQLMSNFIIRSRLRFTPSAELDVIAIPVYGRSNYRYDLFDIGDNAHFAEAVLPDKKLKNAGFGARMNFELPAIGFSLSYFRGYNPFYGFRVENIEISPEIDIEYVADFYKKNTLGADFALPVNNSIIRGELAYNHTKDYEQNMHIPNPDISYVAGFEKNIFDIISIVQYVGKHTLNYEKLQKPVMPEPPDPDNMMQYAIDMINYESELFNRKIFQQQEKFNHAFMVTLNRSFAYEVIDVELAGYYNITSEEYLIRPGFTWRLTDRLTAQAGASLMYGKEGSIYDLSGEILNGVFISLKASF